MTYQDLVNLIRTTATAVNASGYFRHGTRAMVSQESYNEALPLIAMFPPESTFEDNQAFNARRHTLQLAFWKQDSPESSTTEQEAIIADMDTLARAFLLSLDGSATTLLIQSVRMQPDYRQVMGTFSGYLMQLELTAAVDVC